MFLTVAWVPYKWDELLYKIRCTITTLNLVDGAGTLINTVWVDGDRSFENIPAQTDPEVCTDHHSH